MTKDKFKTYENVFDNFTTNNLRKLAAQGYFDEVKSTLAVGKESNVFIATKGNSKVIVKIYRLETCDFNKMYQYIRYDPRYVRLRRQKRSTIFSWTQREYRNLLKAREANVKVPVPIHFKDNILILEMIGNPAPQLKNHYPEDSEKFFKKILTYMKKLHKAGLVHGDLSEFNILNLKDNPVFIDFSQATERKSILYKELLERDCKNMARFAKKLGITTTKEEIYQEIISATQKPRN